MRDTANTYELEMVSSVRIAQGYASDLRHLCTGSQNFFAEDAFSQIFVAIRNKKLKLEDEIAFNNMTIKNLEEEIAYLKSRVVLLS